MNITGALPVCLSSYVPYPSISILQLLQVDPILPFYITASAPNLSLYSSTSPIFQLIQFVFFSWLQLLHRCPLLFQIILFS